MKCSICKNEIEKIGDWDSGNNAEPINSGRSYVFWGCEKCNMEKVIPARLEQLNR